ncbi:MAG: two-component system copper resistance phosphate regulon response regulator CusR [Myxococcota bacterium]|jgi:two-component system copper resistance phosphate regulon response regulator CusR
MRLLVVEDRAPLREAIVRRLTTLGFGVDAAETLAAARAFERSWRYDAIVLDRGMPDGDGVELLAAWRAAGVRTPVLVLTARDSIRDRVTGLESGADDYLVKPFAMAELVARIRVITRRVGEAGEPAPASISIGGVVLDLQKAEVRVDGVLIPLRPREFSVLEVLFQRADRVVSRGQLLEACWGEGASPDSNVEEVTVSALRRKIGKKGLIRTVRGRGYIVDRAP